MQLKPITRRNWTRHTQLSLEAVFVLPEKMFPGLTGKLNADCK
jgi:hypothetical protein